MNFDDVRRQLTPAEATPLCLVTVAALLRSAGIRALAIKGPAFDALGVRQPRVSSDVDVLIDPRKVPLAHTILESAGWRDWAPEPLWGPFGAHSTTMEHPLWLCTLDAHSNFPGFLAGPQATFDHLWDARTEIDVAHQKVLTLCRPHALALETLHLLRGTSPDAEADVVRDVLAAMPQPLTPSEAATLGPLLGRSGSSGTLATLATLTGVLAPGTTPDQRASLADWRSRQRSSAAPLAWWFEALRNNPVKALIRGLEHAWLTDGQARTWAKAKGVDYRGRVHVFSLRLAKGVRATRIQFKGLFVRSTRFR